MRHSPPQTKASPADIKPASRLFTSPYWIAIGGAASIAIGLGMTRFAYTAILPSMKIQLGLSPLQAGYLATANLSSYVLGSLLPIWFAWQKRAVSPGTLLWFGWIMALVFTLTMALPNQFGLGMLLSRALAGVSGALLMNAASAMVIRAAHESGKHQLIGIHYGGVGCGIVLSSLCVIVLESQQANWASYWLVHGALIALLILPSLLVLLASRLNQGHQQHANNVHSSSAHHLGNQTTRVPRTAWYALIWLLAAYFFAGLGYIVSATFLPLIAKSTPALANDATASWLVFGLAAIVSNVLWMKLSYCWGLLRTLGIAYAVQAAGVMLPVFSSSVIALYGSGLLLGGTFMGIVALGNTLACQLLPPARAHLAAYSVAAMSAIHGLGQTIGPYIAGMLATRQGNFSAGLWIAALGLLAGIALLRGCDHARKQFFPENILS